MTSITFSAVLGTNEEQEETSTHWIGRGSVNSKTGRRDILLSAPIPQITAEQIPLLDANKLASLINDGVSDYLRRVKIQRLNPGSSYTLHGIPDSKEELAIWALEILTEGSRERSVLSAATLRDLINGDEFKAAAAARCQQQGIKPEAFKRVIIDGLLRACTRQDFCIYEGQEQQAAKAAIHLRAILPAITNAANNLALDAAIKRIETAQVVDAEGGI